MPQKPVRKKEKLSKEESLYRSAVSLMDAVDCVSRFEVIVSSLNDAAKKFEKLGDYKDAVLRKEECLNNAKDIAVNGAAEVFNTALGKLGCAKTKSDFIDVAQDFKLVRKFDYKREECNKNIQCCQKRIRRIETIAAFRRYVIVICILVICTLIFINTPLFPLVKKLLSKF